MNIEVEENFIYIDGDDYMSDTNSKHDYIGDDGRNIEQAKEQSEKISTNGKRENSSAPKENGGGVFLIL